MAKSRGRRFLNTWSPMTLPTLRTYFKRSIKRDGYNEPNGAAVTPFVFLAAASNTRSLTTTTPLSSLLGINLLQLIKRSHKVFPLHCQRLLPCPPCALPVH